MSFPELHTTRLRLIEINESHTQRYFEIMSLDKVTLYYGMESLVNIEQAKDIISSFKKGYESKRSFRWGIVNKEDNTFIGTVGLNNVQLGNRKAEIGFEIHPDFWNSGYTSEASRAVVQYVFEELDLYRLGAITFIENAASQRLLKKLGFKEEGILRGNIFQNGISHDTYIFSLLQHEWKQNSLKSLQGS
jgi:[ribosomal protein S5]-alanine N-acetyltransferase